MPQAKEWDQREQKCSEMSHQVFVPGWPQGCLVNVEKRTVPNRLVIEVCDQVKPGIQSVYWIGVVEVEGDVVVKIHRKGMVVGRYNIASIDLQILQDEQEQRSKSLRWRWAGKYRGNLSKCAIEYVLHGWFQRSKVQGVDPSTEKYVEIGSCVPLHCEERLVLLEEYTFGKLDRPSL